MQNTIETPHAILPYEGAHDLSVFENAEMSKSDLSLLNFSGCSYVVPAMGDAELKFMEINACMFGRPLTKHVNVLVDENVTDPSLKMDVVMARSEKSGYTDNVTVALYKVGCPVPIKVSRVLVEEYIDFDVDFKFDKYDEMFGRYFVMLANVKFYDEDEPFTEHEEVGPYIIVPFRIIRKREIKSVKGVGVDVSMVDASTNKINVCVEMNTSLDYEPECCIECYDAALNMMGTCKTIANGTKLEFELASYHEWRTGHYTALVACENELWASFKFAINASGQLSVAQLMQGEDEKLGRLLTFARESSAWGVLSQTAIYKPLRDYSLKSFRLHNVLAARYEQGMAMPPLSGVIGCVGPYTSGLEEAVAALAVKYNVMSLDAVDGMEMTVPPQNDGNPFSPNSSPIFAKGGGYMIYNLSYIISGECAVYMQKIRSLFEEGGVRFLALVGTAAEIKKVKETYDFIGARMGDEDIIDLTNVDALSVLFDVETQLAESALQFTQQSRGALKNWLAQAEEAGMLVDWTDVKTLGLARKISDNVVNRFEKLAFSNELAETDLAIVTEEDVVLPKIEKTAVVDDYEQCVAELNSMIGLDGVKKQMLQAANMARFELLRRNSGVGGKVAANHHMIFMGNPGTGKTTVAKFVGRIYRSLGLLSKGEVIVTERSKMVGRYIGQTERIMRDLLKEAKGNVLFVDEAYTLVTDKDDSSDYGHRAIEALLTVLSQKDPDMIVIFAGYEKEINRMMEVNPGLRGRFPIKLKFDDYNATQLYEIAKYVIANDGFVLSREADEALLQAVEKACKDRGEDFSNARWVEQFVRNGIIMSMASRVMASSKSPDVGMLQTIEKADVDAAIDIFKPKVEERRRIGF